MKITLSLCFSTALVLAGAVIAQAETGSAGTIRIKTGIYSPLTDEAGVVWQADSGFVGGDTIERPGLTIANTKTPSVYRAERYGMAAFRQPVPNGKYTVKLHFAETYEDINAAGQRVFSYKVEDKDFKDFDVFKSAGGALRAYVETVVVDVQDGSLDITFTTQVENPEINALEIIPMP
jgi:endoglucanase